MADFHHLKQHSCRDQVTALEHGYKITHIGLLCWTLLPTLGLVPRVRAWFLLLKAALAFVFHAAIAAITDDYIPHLILWPHESIKYKLSHSSH